MKKILLALIPAGAVAGSVLGILPAHAASTFPPKCSGDVCAEVSVSAAGTTITTWAYDQTFDGDFKIATIDGVYASPVQTWEAGGPGHTFTVPGERGDFATAEAVGTLPQPPGGQSVTPVPGDLGQVTFTVP